VPKSPCRKWPALRPCHFTPGIRPACTIWLDITREIWCSCSCFKEPAFLYIIFAYPLLERLQFFSLFSLDYLAFSLSFDEMIELGKFISYFKYGYNTVDRHQSCSGTFHLFCITWRQTVESSKLYTYIQTCTMLHPEDCASNINRRENFKHQINSVQE